MGERLRRQRVEVGAGSFAGGSEVGSFAAGVEAAMNDEVFGLGSIPNPFFATRRKWYSAAGRQAGSRGEGLLMFLHFVGWQTHRVGGVFVRPQPGAGAPFEEVFGFASALWVALPLRVASVSLSPSAASVVAVGAVTAWVVNVCVVAPATVFPA